MLDGIITAVGAFGLGALAQSVIQHWLESRKYAREREYKEKREAYFGFLDAVTKSEVSPSQETSIIGGHWINRCEIVGSNEVISLLSEFLETNPADGSPHPDRPTVMKKLKTAIRDDLRRT